MKPPTAIKRTTYLYGPSRGARSSEKEQWLVISGQFMNGYFGGLALNGAGTNTARREVASGGRWQWVLDATPQVVEWLATRSFAWLRISPAGSCFAHACCTPQVRVRRPPHGCSTWYHFV